MWVQTSRNVDITRISNGNISYCLHEATVTWSRNMVGHAGSPIMRMLIWPWPDPRSRLRSLAFSIFANCTFYVYLLRHFAWSSKLMVDYDTMGPSLQLFEARFLISPLPVGGHVTSKFVKCWYHQNPLGFIFTLPAARSLWLWLQETATSCARWRRWPSAPLRAFLKIISDIHKMKSTFFVLRQRFNSLRPNTYCQ